mmetsp:Transcript_6864/g.16827  ORF Transcript_6864/g.16827 Transcript_6864/m.16827 type:complete len:102 (+) Transcript_6864:211-516(+)
MVGLLRLMMESMTFYSSIVTKHTYHIQCSFSKTTIWLACHIFIFAKGEYEEVCRKDIILVAKNWIKISTIKILEMQKETKDSFCNQTPHSTFSGLGHPKET